MARLDQGRDLAGKGAVAIVRPQERDLPIVLGGESARYKTHERYQLWYNMLSTIMPFARIIIKGGFQIPH